MKMENKEENNKQKGKRKKMEKNSMIEKEKEN